MGPGDIRYFSTVQQANNTLILMLRPDQGDGTYAAATSDHADYDLYASPTSPTTTPGPGWAGVDYQWVSDNGRYQNSNGKWQMYDDYIAIPPVGYARYIYYSVYYYGGTGGGFRVYDNTVGKQWNPWYSATDFNDRADPSNWQKLVWAMQMDTAGLYSATDGTAYIPTIFFYSNDNTCGGHGCNIIYHQPNDQNCCGGAWACCTCVGCNFQGCGGSQEINCGRWSSLYGAVGGGYNEATVTAHEGGHCLYNLYHEYNSNPDDGGFACGHTIMRHTNANEWQHERDYCTGTLTTGNHGMDPNNANTAIGPSGNWTLANNCNASQFTYYLPSGSPHGVDPILTRISGAGAHLGS